MYEYKCERVYLVTDEDMVDYLNKKGWYSWELVQCTACAGENYYLLIFKRERA